MNLKPFKQATSQGRVELETNTDVIDMEAKGEDLGGSLGFLV